MVTDADEDEDAPDLVRPPVAFHQFTVPQNQPAERLDRFLAAALPSLSRARIQALMEQGHVLLNGKETRPSAKVKGGETLTVEEPAPVVMELLAQDLPLDVMFEDGQLVVVNKAAGMVVHPAFGNPDGTLVNALMFHVRDLGGVGGELRPGIVHRLDRDTSGVMVVAKQDSSLKALQAQFKARSTEKRYLAVVRGVPRARSGTYETEYGRHPTMRQKFTAKAGPRNAITDWRVVASSSETSALELTLHTGRTHQIRVHLSEAGFPILGDQVYGGRSATQAPRQMLHATVLGLSHPQTGRAMKWVAPIPADMESVLREALLWDAVSTWWRGLAG